MPAETLPTSSSLFFHGFGRAERPAPIGRARACQDDPALLVGLALAFTRQGNDGASAIPFEVVARLREHADDGDPACRLVLDWLTEKANMRHDRATSAPAEIASASKEDC
jgi:hypothetical protein